MKQRIFFTAIVLFLTTMTFAQPPQGQFNREDRIKLQTEDMVKNLGLDEAQTVKVTAINKKYGEKMGEIFQSSGEDREARREKMQKLTEEKNAELKVILTAEQFKTYLEMEEKRMEERRQRRQENGGNSPERRGTQRGTGGDQ